MREKKPKKNKKEVERFKENKNENKNKSEKKDRKDRKNRKDNKFFEKKVLKKNESENEKIKKVYITWKDIV